MSTHYYTIAPPPALAPYVRAFWIFEHDVEPGSSYVYRAMADGCAELVFHYKGTFNAVAENEHQGPLYNFSLLHAQSRHFKRFITQESFGIFGAYLYPFAIPQLFGQASPNVADLMINLNDFAGPAGKLLEEQIMLARDNQARARLLSTFLLEHLNKQKPKDAVIQAAVKQVVHSTSLQSIEQLSYQFNLSQRQFERRFTEHAGFTPKVYSRIIRFQSALNQYGGSFKSLTDLAYECGYYDQSHFIHEFREFSGYHPGQYFKGRPEGIEYREV